MQKKKKKKSNPCDWWSQDGMQTMTKESDFITNLWYSHNGRRGKLTWVTWETVFWLETVRLNVTGTIHCT